MEIFNTEEFQKSTIGALIKRVEKQYKEELEKVSAQEKEGREKLLAFIEKEAKLKAKIKKAQAIVKGMEKDYLQIEAALEAKKRKAIEKESITKGKVKSGEYTVNEFMKKGKTDLQIIQKAIEKTALELEQLTDAIREKNLEILNLEKPYYEGVTEIRYLASSPALILKKVYKSLGEFLTRELSAIMEGGYSDQTRLTQTIEMLQKIDGKSISERHAWTGLTQEEARAVCFDPVLPKELITTLKKQLAKYRDSDTIEIYLNVWKKTLNVNTGPVMRGGVITTSSKEEPIKKAKLSTREIDVSK